MSTKTLKVPKSTLNKVKSGNTNTFNNRRIITKYFLNAYPWMQSDDGDDKHHNIVNTRTQERVRVNCYTSGKLMAGNPKDYDVPYFKEADVHYAFVLNGKSLFTVYKVEHPYRKYRNWCVKNKAVGIPFGDIQDMASEVKLITTAEICAIANMMSGEFTWLHAPDDLTLDDFIGWDEFYTDMKGELEYEVQSVRESMDAAMNPQPPTLDNDKESYEALKKKVKDMMDIMESMGSWPITKQ